MTWPIFSGVTNAGCIQNTPGKMIRMQLRFGVLVNVQG